MLCGYLNNVRNKLATILPNKYKVRDYQLDDEFLTLSFYKVEDLGYEGSCRPTPREMEELQYLVENFFDCYCIVDHINNSIYCNLFIQ